MENMEKSEAGLADLRHAIRGGECEDLRGSGKNPRGDAWEGRMAKEKERKYLRNVGMSYSLLAHY